MNVEAYEHAMDAQWRMNDRVHLTDLYDSAQDARSEARYEDDPRSEPDTGEVKDTLARMGQETTESAAEGLIFRG